MSTFTRSITFNDQAATLTFPTKLNSSNQLDWTVTLTSGTNKVSTTGTVALELSSLKTPTTPDSTGPVTSWPTSMIAVVDENKAKHVAFIKEALNTIETATGRDAKAACAKMMFDYLTICGMDFIKAHERFKHTVIAKAYELKKEAPERSTMVDSMNKVLTALDQPLEKPSTLPPPPGLTRQVACGGSLTYCGCTGCPDLTDNPSKVVSQSILNKKDAPYNPDMALFIALAKKHDAKTAIENPTTYFSYYENALKWRSINGTTKAEKMDDYLSRWSDGAAREKLMKTLFTKNDLVFSDTVMTLYDEWQKTYKPTGYSNRYKKMCAFIDAHKTLFTAA